MWAVIIVTTTLPGALVAWSEPDPPAEEPVVAVAHS
jgi:hypothetical protein